MHVAYCLALFPNRSETFLLREIERLRREGLAVSVWALGRAGDAQNQPNATDGVGRVVYRPSWRSVRAWGALVWICACRPHRLPILLACLIHVASGGSLRSTLALVRNLHAVAFFARDGLENGVDVVHGGFMNLPGLLAMAVSIVIDRPLTVAAHARDLFVEGDACCVLVRRARAVVVCHAFARKWLAGHFDVRDRAKLRLIHHGLDPDLYRMGRPADLGRDAQPLLVLAVGRIVEKKGFDVLIESCRRLAARGASFRVRIAGDGPQRDRLTRLARDANVGDRLSFAGWQDEGSLGRLLSRCAVMVVPSVVATDGDRDGIPNVLLEACAAGVPVVATRLEGITEVIEDGVTGLLVRPGDPEDLARALAEVLADDALRHRLATCAQRRVESRFDIRVTVRQWVRLFLEVGRVRRAA